MGRYSIVTRGIEPRRIADSTGRRKRIIDDAGHPLLIGQAEIDGPVGITLSDHRFSAF